MTIEQYNKGVDEWADGAYSFAIHCGGSSEDSRDAVQEAFAVLWEKREKVDFEKGRSFVLTVVHRQIVNHFRRRGRIELKPEINDEDNPSTTSETAHTLFDSKSILAECMQKMNEQQRALLRLRDIEGYSYREIAQILELSEQQVMVYLYRARIALKKALLAYGVSSLTDI